MGRGRIWQREAAQNAVAVALLAALLTLPNCGDTEDRRTKLGGSEQTSGAARSTTGGAQQTAGTTQMTGGSEQRGGSAPTSGSSPEPTTGNAGEPTATAGEPSGGAAQTTGGARNDNGGEFGAAGAAAAGGAAGDADAAQAGAAGAPVNPIPLSSRCELVADGYCTGNFLCATHQACVEGRCVTLPEGTKCGGFADESLCPNDMTCVGAVDSSGAGGVCQYTSRLAQSQAAAPGVGDRCYAPNDCPAGSLCVAFHGALMETCVPEAQQGEDCSQAACKYPLFCVTARFP